ncbi:MAG TPA: phosphate ABC transporter ATP-binding protein PstB [Chloroflexia bacterium]|nr:phosphate ABC transporter ATP-binding protein PstB [Chloroflexia bacterium]
MQERGERVIDLKPEQLKRDNGVQPGYELPPQREVAKAPGANGAHGLRVSNLNAWFGNFQAIRDVSVQMKPGAITALIGPSGSGKSTFLRCLNRMHEAVPGARAAGEVVLDGENILGSRVDPVLVRRRIGMVFQRPNPFPTKSIFENVAAGLRIQGAPRSVVAERVERSLRQTALWDEVKDKLNAGGTDLSGGQQQRLCIARALAIEPEIILMDEPASALDPIATLKIEDLMVKLRERYTLVIVTHNMQQAARVSDYTGVFMTSINAAGTDRTGELVEFGETRQIFTNPVDPRTEAYITGRIG